ncbi:MAG: shikimate dehydrogenase [Opitutae bacterium]|nr:shikimate dehydrogenase [Opitutae bacterium]
MSPAADPVHTLADLENWSFAGTALAVVGHPIAHSLSPAMHNAALADLARTDPRFGDWRYFKFDLAAADLPRALALFHAQRFCGLNLTVPHKVLALDHLVARDAVVQAAGAANTLRRTDAGWEGFNTDGAGFAHGLRDDLGVELRGAAVILLGAGGAARGAAVECLRQDCRQLWIGNRSAAHGAALVAGLRRVFPAAALRNFDLAAPPAGLPADSLVVNATSLGLQPDDPAPIDLLRLPRPARIYDMIYHPPSTPLLRQAAELNLPHANGLSMLVQQGVRALGLWTGAAASVDVMRRAARARLSS